MIRPVLAHDNDEPLCTNCARALGGVAPTDGDISLVATVRFVACCICNVWYPCIAIGDWAWPTICGLAPRRYDPDDYAPLENALSAPRTAVGPPPTHGGSPQGDDGRHATPEPQETAFQREGPP